MASVDFVSGLENICKMGMQSVFLPESGGGVEYLTLTGKRKKFGDNGIRT